MSQTRGAILALAGVIASLTWSRSASAEEPHYRFDAAAGFLRLSQFKDEDAVPTALVWGGSGAEFFARWFGAGIALRLSQADSYRAPCEAQRFCLRRFQQFGLFAETRWTRPELAVAWEPWFRLGADAVQAASAPPTAEGAPGVQWAAGLDGKVGSDLRLRWLVLGIYGEAAVASGDIRSAYGLGLRVGVAIGLANAGWPESP